MANKAYFRALRYQLEPPFDSDDDGLPDYWEMRYFGGLSPGPADDTDGDGLSHLEEVGPLSNPTIVDTDGDSLTDFEEVASDIGSNPNLSDSDGDGLDDGIEVNNYGTNPTKRDSDSDSYDDAYEIEFASDPNDRDDIPDPGKAIDLYAEDLMVHFEFDSIDDGLIRNHGQLGGFGRLVGDGAHILGEAESKSSSGALELRMDPNDASKGTHIVTDYSLHELGMAGEEAEFTVSLWMRSIEEHLSTIFSLAGQEDGSSELLGLYLKPGGAFISGSSLRAERLDEELSVFNYDLDKRWTHVVWTVSSGEWTIYIGGNVVAQGNRSVGGTLEDAATLWIGALFGEDGPTEHFFGAMDDFRVYRKALPESVVSLLSRRK